MNKMVKADPEHVHTYDDEGNLTCCSLEEKIETRTLPLKSIFDHEDHDHDLGYLWPIFSFSMLISGLIMEHVLEVTFFKDPIKLAWYVMAYLPVALPVICEAWAALKKGEVFTEFFLMAIATLGAFAIGEYPEGVAVMLFYAVGELFQTAAVKRAKGNIKALLDVRPDIAHLKLNGELKTVDPREISIGDTIVVKTGEVIPLDSILMSENATFNAAALTGESKPLSMVKGDVLMSGSINLNSVIELKVSKRFEDSSVSRILHLVQDATARKAPTELLIRRLAKIYTPIVTYMAIGICILPYFFVADYDFQTWLYRALIFLVISCPCALVISIPLGYFGGLGASSRNGILFKGAAYMDILSEVKVLVADKTGTFTKGVFSVQDIQTEEDMDNEKFIHLISSLESVSNHPIAKAIQSLQPQSSYSIPQRVEEIAGKGIKGNVDGYDVLCGNTDFLDDNNIEAPSIEENGATYIAVAINGSYAGSVTIADELKHDAKEAIVKLNRSGIKHITMLSGDSNVVTKRIAGMLGIDHAIGGLLPEDKLTELEKIKASASGKVAFVGDGINDAPVLAASDLGIAMGAMGSDIAIETADMVIQTDQPSKIVTGIKISNATRRIIWQNIAMALGVKILVLILGAGGIATMWEAVFADVGVALMAILNAIRIQRMEFE